MLKDFDELFSKDLDYLLVDAFFVPVSELTHSDGLIRQISIEDLLITQQSYLLWKNKRNEFTTTYHCKTNGKVERYNRMINSAIQNYFEYHSKD